MVNSPTNLPTCPFLTKYCYQEVGLPFQFSTTKKLFFLGL